MLDFRTRFVVADRRPRLVLAACAWMAVSSWALADVPQAPAPSPEYLPRPSAKETELLAALGRPVSFEFEETPLETVVNTIKLRDGVAIQLDVKSILESGIGLETPITCRQSDVPLDTALRQLLGTLDLAYIVRDELIFVTTVDVAESWTFTRIYPVGDLAVTADDYRRLVEVIESQVRPRSWSDSGGNGKLSYLPRAGSLIVTQTWANQNRVLDLLRSLRSAKHATAELMD